MTPATAPPPLPGPGQLETRYDGRLTKSEVLSALSRALDLTEGQPPGHTLRACAIGMRLAEEAGVPEEDRHSLYYALLLKDAGCSSNAARMSTLFGSPDQAVKYGMKLVDWHRALPLALRTARMVGLGQSLRTRIRHFFRIARGEDVTRELIQIRCDRGADIVLRLGFPADSAETVRCLDEHWCGLGYPEGKFGEEIPILARIANLAQTVEIYASAHGVDEALAVARERSGSWFDPRLVRILEGWKSDVEWWAGLRAPDLEQRVVAMEPGGAGREIDDDGLDAIALAFAEIIDAKSPYTYHHSTNVANFARAIGRERGLGETELRNLHRAGLLHDIGKLGISNRILDKNGPLDAGERRAIEHHPIYSWEILHHVAAFRPFARSAVVHHEKLDGTGYPWHLRGEELNEAERALCVADIYEALTADRPYRAGMPAGKALSILQEDVPHRLCRDSVEALEASLSR